MRKSLISVAAASILAIGFTGCGSDKKSYTPPKEKIVNVHVNELDPVIRADVESGDKIATGLGSGDYKFTIKSDLTTTIISENGCVDSNRNNACDIGEPSAVTYKAPAGHKYLNPFTTILVETELSQDEIANAFNVSTDVFSKGVDDMSLEEQKALVLANAFLLDLQQEDKYGTALYDGSLICGVTPNKNSDSIVKDEYNEAGNNNNDNTGSNEGLKLPTIENTETTNIVVNNNIPVEFPVTDNTTTVVEKETNTEEVIVDNTTTVVEKETNTEEVIVENNDTVVENSNSIKLPGTTYETVNATVESLTVEDVKVETEATEELKIAGGNETNEEETKETVTEETTVIEEKSETNTEAEEKTTSITLPGTSRNLREADTSMMPPSIPNTPVSDTTEEISTTSESVVEVVSETVNSSNSGLVLPGVTETPSNEEVIEDIKETVEEETETEIVVTEPAQTGNNYLNKFSLFASYVEAGLDIYTAMDKVINNNELKNLANATTIEEVKIISLALHEDYLCIVNNDLDGDGVPNDSDQCPSTPKNDKVNEVGCTIKVDEKPPVLKDADSDGVMDINDNCPYEAGPKYNLGCPDKMDSDGDGVYDDADNCPATPKDEEVDEFGCTLVLDSDNDGVADENDVCPNTPVGSTVNEVGCTDSDNDGLFDNDDECPTEEGTVKGCPDKDGDGVADKNDKCPDVAGDGADGCIINKDVDNDGINNNIDSCPNTETNAKTNANGCSVEQLSSKYPNQAVSSDLSTLSEVYISNYIAKAFTQSSIPTIPEMAVNLEVVLNGESGYIPMHTNYDNKKAVIKIFDLANGTLVGISNEFTVKNFATIQEADLLMK